MKIEAGLLDCIVLQRSRKNVSQADFTGSCEVRGQLTATIRKNGKTVRGFGERSVGSASRGKFAGRIAGLPVGGPYQVELCIHAKDPALCERLTVRDVLVGDVWVLGGQSNMQGCGLLKDKLKANPMVRAFYMNDSWAPACDPIHDMWDCVDQVHIDYCGGVRPPKSTVIGVGPGVSFGQRLFALTGIPQGMLACAHGGTSMEQWDPKLKKLGTKSLYGATMRRFRKNGARVAGLVWYQGCSDATKAAAPHYTKRMKAMIAAMRRDFRNPSMPAAVVQIARVVGWGPENTPSWNSIQDQQRRLASVVPHCTVVPAIDLALDDGIHISGAGQNCLGVRLADAMHGLRQGGPRQRQIALGKVSVITEDGHATVVAEFDNTRGSLRSAGRPSGFDVVDFSGNSQMFDVTLAKNTARVRLWIGAQDVSGMALHYGYGVGPYCNATDAAGRPLPVFGPVFLGAGQAVTPYIKTMRVSAFQPAAGKLNDLECPARLDHLGMASRTFGSNFCDLHDEIAKTAPEDIHVFYACRIRCDEAMNLTAQLGYDGPVKAWVDGKQIYHDPNGVNPAIAGAGKATFDVDQGEHEIVVALGSNDGKAWGIFLRLARHVPARLLTKEPRAFTMPEILG
jgi:hypothetical protein